MCAYLTCSRGMTVKTNRLVWRVNVLPFTPFRGSTMLSKRSGKPQGLANRLSLSVTRIMVLSLFPHFYSVLCVFLLPSSLHTISVSLWISLNSFFFLVSLSFSVFLSLYFSSCSRMLPHSSSLSFVLLLPGYTCMLSLHDFKYLLHRLSCWWLETNFLISVYIHSAIHVHTHTLCMYIHTGTYTYMCVYIYVCVYIHMCTSIRVFET